MKNKKGAHVRMANTKEGVYLMFCLHCSRSVSPTLPIELTQFVYILEGFNKEHQECEEGPYTITAEEAAGRFGLKG